MGAATLLASALLGSVAVFALAQAAAPPSGPPPANSTSITGSIEKWDGKALTVKTASGSVAVTVGADAPIMTRKPAKLSDIGPNTFLGTTTVPRNGRLEAIEVHLFPESMRGAGEGHYPWQGEPGSMMTNGAVTMMTNGSVASIAKGGVMKVSYKDGDKGMGTKDVYVPADVSVTVIERLSAAALKPGVRVNGQVQQNADGSVSATRLNIVP